MNPLEQLKDIHLPQEVGLWPLAYGWWLMIILSFVTLLACLVAIKRFRDKRLAKRQALALINEIEKNAAEDTSWQSNVNAVLKQAAIHYFSKQEVSLLYGKEWLSFLSQALPSKKRQAFSDGISELLDSLYQSSQLEDRKQSIDAARLWLTHALPPKSKGEA